MKKLLLLLTSALATLVLPGCFQSETTVHLNKDGSGTLVEDTRLGAQMIAMFDQMAALGAETGGADPVAKMFSEDKAKTRAAELGEGVTFVKSEPVNAEGARGARTTYRFEDINQLKLNTGDSMKNLSPMGAPAAAPKANPVTFSYTDGTLTIRMPEPEKPAAPAADAAPKPDMDNPQAQAMVQQMLSDMKIGVKFVIEPGIEETNASHRDGNTITLVQMNMGKVVENPDNLKKLTSLDQENPVAAMEALKGIDGVTLETNREVTVKLK